MRGAIPHVFDVLDDDGLMKMCRLSSAEIAQIAKRHFGPGSHRQACIAFGREVAKKSLMQAAALHPVFDAELEKEPISVAYSSGASTALSAYSCALKKLVMGHVQDEAEDAGKFPGISTNEQVTEERAEATRAYGVHDAGVTSTSTAASPDPVAAIRSLEAPINSATDLGYITPDTSNKMYRKLRRAERLIIEVERGLQADVRRSSQAQKGEFHAKG